MQVERRVAEVGRVGREVVGEERELERLALAVVEGQNSLRCTTITITIITTTITITIITINPSLTAMCRTITATIKEVEGRLEGKVVTPSPATESPLLPWLLTSSLLNLGAGAYLLTLLPHLLTSLTTATSKAALLPGMAATGHLGRPIMAVTPGMELPFMEGGSGQPTLTREEEELAEELANLELAMSQEGLQMARERSEVQPLYIPPPAQSPTSPAQSPSSPAQSYLIPAQPQYSPAQPQYNPAQPQYNPAQSPTNPAQRSQGPAQRPQGPAQQPEEGPAWVWGDSPSSDYDWSGRI